MATLVGHRRWLVFGVLLLLLGCGASGRARLEALPEASLMFPGSEELADGGSERAWGIEGERSAATWVIRGTDSSVEDVLTFYQRELTEGGWVEYPMSRTTSEDDAYGWRHPEAGARIRLGFLETEEWYLRLEDSDRFETLYDFQIIERSSIGGDPAAASVRWRPGGSP